MKKLIAVTLLALTLTACAGGPGAIDPKVQQALDYVRAACKYVPTIATIVAIFQSEGPFATGTGVGQQICTALEQNPMTEGIKGGRTVPKVNGIVIKGHYLK